MGKQIGFFDGAQSSTTPTIGNVDTTNLASYPDDATYEAANAGSPSEGNIYANTTLNVIRYYNGTQWSTVVDAGATVTLTNKTIDGTSATGTNTVTIDADDASYDNITSGLTATNAQSAIDEVEGRLDTAETDITTAQGSADANTADIADIRTVTGTADGATNMGTFTGTTLTDNTSVKTLLQELETAVEAVGGALVFAGTWNASTNTPTLSDGTGTTGEFYIVSDAGSTSLDGITDWNINDWAIFDGTVWRQIDNSELVTSVNGATGTVSLALGDLDNADEAGAGSRDTLRRNIANTRWEDFNPNQINGDGTSGSNVTLASVSDTALVRLTSGTLVSVDMIPVAYNQARTIVTNDTANVITFNNETGATASQHIVTGTGGPLDLAPDASIYLIYDQTTAKWKIVGGSGSGEGGVSGIITSNNSTSDSTTGDWAAYADAADTTPVDGTGGSPNITIARTTVTSEILQGKGSFELTKGAFDRQGEGVSLDLEVPRYIRGQASQISFSYQTTADFDHGSAADPVASPSDISVYLYDVTNSKIINTNRPGVFGGGLYKANVQVPSDCEDIRVILHIATTNALAWDFIFDRVQLDVAPFEFLKNTSDWSDYTPIFSGLGTVSNVDVKYRIDGSDILIAGTCTTGTVAATEAQIGLPEGMSIGDSIGSIQVVGTSGQDAASAYSGVFLLGTAGDTYVNVARFGAGTTPGTGALTPGNGSTVYGSSTDISFECRVPVQGLTSGVSHPASIGLNAQVILRASGNAASVGASSPVIFPTVDDDTVGAYDNTTGEYTAKSPGYYSIAGATTQTTDTSYHAYVDGAIGPFLGRTDNSTGLGSYVGSVYLDYGQVLTIRPSGATDPSITNITIYKIGSDPQPYAPRIAYLKDVKSNTTDGGTFTSGAWQTRDLNTLSGDSSFISISSNQFTLQPGTYHIKAEAPSAIVQRNKAKLRNITDTSDTLIGSNSFTDGDEAMMATSVIEGEFSISSATVFEIQHRCEITRATNGFGFASSFSIDEVYTQVKITKVL